MFKHYYITVWSGGQLRGEKAAAAAVAWPLVSSVVRRWVLFLFQSRLDTERVQAPIEREDPTAH